MQEAAPKLDRERQFAEFWRRIPLFWRFQLGGWIAFWIFSFPVKVAVLGAIDPAVWLGLFREILAFFLTLAMRAFYRRIYRHPMDLGRLAITIGAVSLFGGILLSILSIALEDCLGIAAESRVLSLENFALLYFSTSVFVGWSVLYFGIRLLRDSSNREVRLAQAEARQREAELQMLRAQMNPHFLFNALNTILADLGKPVNNLKNVVQALAEYLRYSLEHRNDDLVEIGTEFDAVVGYLTVEKARFREELEIDCRIDETARTAAVPGIFLQPLVENAIKYGRQTSSIPLKVRVRVFPPESGRILMEVSNTGRWTEPDPRRKLGGVGLSNLRQRLALLYPGRHIFGTAEENGCVTARLEIPFSPTK